MLRVALVPNHFDVADLFNIDVKLVSSPSEKRSILKSRNLLCYWPVSELA